MRLLSFLNDGTIPDIRGNAPAIVAQNLLRYCPEIERFSFVNEEDYSRGIVHDELYGTIFRENASKPYRRLFQKITRLDPWPRWRRAAHFANKMQIDLVHAHQLEFPVDQFRNSLKNRNTPIAVHMHVRRTYNPALGTADRYLAVSEYTKRLLTEQYGYPASITDVVYNGVDTSTFHPVDNETRARIKHSLGIPENAIVLSYVGRKVSSKGYLAFLASAAKLLPDISSLYVVAAGMTPDGNRNDPFVREIDSFQLALKNHPRYLDLPALPHNLLKDIYQCTDVLQFATYFGDETFGMVAVEGMATGCIVIASKHSALPEIITDEIDGLLVDDPRDIESVIAKTADAISKIKTLEILRQEARKTAVTRFDWGVSASHLRSIYESMRNHRHIS